MPTFGDTTTNIANFSEIIDVVNQVSEALEMEYAVMGNLVTRHEIPRGQSVVRIPYQTTTFEAQDYTDGDEIAVTQAVGIDTLDLTTNELQITFRISPRALRQPSPDLAALAGDEKAKAQTEALEVRLLALLDDGGTIDLGANGSATTLTHVRQSRRLLRNISRANGGPAKPPIFGVINPIQEEDLLTDLGVVAASTGTSNTEARVIPGFLQSIIDVSPSLEDSFFGSILRIPFFVSGYIGDTIGSISTPSWGGVFAKKEMHLGVAADWDTEPFSEAEWPGIIIRSMTDYGTRVGAYPSKIIQFDTAIS